MPPGGPCRRTSDFVGRIDVTAGRKTDDLALVGFGPLPLVAIGGPCRLLGRVCWWGSRGGGLRDRGFDGRWHRLSSRRGAGCLRPALISRILSALP